METLAQSSFEAAERCFQGKGEEVSFIRTSHILIRMGNVDVLRRTWLPFLDGELEVEVERGLAHTIR